MPALGDLDVFGLCLGGNTFGWTSDEAESFAVLDAYVAAGGNFIDTADGYSFWVPGHGGGESETVLGNWMAARGNRDELVIATKVGQYPGLEGTGAATVRAAAEASLRRLQTDRIDLYYAHIDDEKTPIAETLGAFDALVREGKVREIAASNFSAARLGEALATSDREGFARYVGLQTHYNLVFRDEYEGALRDLCAAEGVACLPFWALGSGFLTGKYRRDGSGGEGFRAQMAGRYAEGTGFDVVDAVERIAADRGVPMAAVALAWLSAQPTVATPLASARTVQQLGELLPFLGLELSGDELARLDTAHAG
ncbi:MAG TPA: aldo/keto reductase [Solirubrobacteraceae bacterium]|nr:aldo/keto reductase [Solirubrobacteraceae bacterium]